MDSCAEQKISIHRVLTVDYCSFLCLVVPVVFAGLFLFLYAIAHFVPFGRITPDSVFVEICRYQSIAAILLAIPILVWRLRIFTRVFGGGENVSALITNVVLHRDRGWVNYTYLFKGQKYQSGNAVHRTRRVNMLLPGHETVLVVDSANPKRAFIKDLYVANDRSST